MLGTEVFVAQHRECEIKRLFVVTAVVSDTGCHIKPVLERRYQVLAAHFHRVHSNLCGKPVQHSFNHIGRFGSASAAISVNRRGVCKHSDDLAANILNLVRTHKHKAEQVCRNSRREGGQVRAHVCVNCALYACDSPVLVADNLPVADVVSAVCSCEVILLPLFSPLDRPTQLLGDYECDNFFGVQVELAAKAAAHIRGDYPYLMLRMPRNESQQKPNEVRNLR